MALIKPEVVFSVIFGGRDSPTCNILIQGWKTEASLDRTCLSDEQWERVSPLLPGKIGDPGRSGADNRQFLEAILWMVRTGSPWRDLPDSYGNWNSMFQRFRRWAKKNVFDRIFQQLSGDPDFEYAMIDGTIVRVHQHGTGAKGGLKIRPSAAHVVD